MVASHIRKLRPLDLAALLLASMAVGIAVTSIMVGAKTSSAVVMLACTFAYSGTGEVAYASVIATGGGLIPAVVASLLVSSRFGLLAMSMRQRWPAPLWERIAIAHVASEPAVAAAIDAGGESPQAARRAFWQIAIWMSLGWIAGSAIGLALGNIVGDTRRIGLDVVFPASFVGAVVHALRFWDTTAAVFLGGSIALVLTPVLPAGLPVLLGSLAAVVALICPSTPLKLR